MKRLNGISLLSLAALLVISAYSHLHYEDHYVTLESFISNPAKCDGQTIGMDGTVFNKTQDYFYLAYAGKKIKILYNNLNDIRYGTLALSGICKKEGYIHALEINYSNYHYLKYFISFAAFFLVIYYIKKEWTVGKMGFAERK